MSTYESFEDKAGSTSENAPLVNPIRQSPVNLFTSSTSGYGSVPGTSNYTVVNPSSRIDRNISQNGSTDSVNGGRTNVCSTSGYEEFHGGELPCPSCKGTGRIPRELENHLVALIPVNDNRLKPRRTKLYVFLAVLGTLLVGALTVFFLVPRSIDLRSNLRYIEPIYASAIFEDSNGKVQISFENAYNVSNSNYFTVTVSSLTMHSTYDQREVSVSHNKTRVSIPPRSSRALRIHMNVTLSGEQGYIAPFCLLKPRLQHSLIFQFQATLASSYLSHTEETTLVTYQRVSCYPTANSSWTTIIPPTSSTTSSTTSATTSKRTRVSTTPLLPHA